MAAVLSRTPGRRRSHGQLAGSAPSLPCWSWLGLSAALCADRSRALPCRYEQYITYGGAVLQVFQMYRLVVLPVANTWMSWSLLHKLGITPGPLVVAATGAAVAALIVAGVQVGSSRVAGVGPGLLLALQL
jgi:hypothetical protein